MSFPTPPGFTPDQFKTPTEPKPEPEPEPEPEPSSNDNSEPQFPDNLEKTELKSAIREYQEWCNQNYDVLDVDLSDIPVEISIKLKKTAGKVAWINGTSEIKYIRYAFKAYQKWGWEKFAETIRHELIHVHTIQNYQKGGHGRLFKMLVDKMDTTRHCESFTEDEAKYILKCSECDKEIGRRHKRSKIVKQPWNYSSQCCSENVKVEENQ